MLPYEVEQRVAELKKDNTTVLAFDIMASDGGELVVIARLLTMQEVSIAFDMQSRDSDLADRWLTETSVDCIWSMQYQEFIDPEDIPVGLYKQATEVILPRSSMYDTNALIEDMNTNRIKQTDIFFAGCAFIMRAFHSYTPLKLKQLTREDFAELLVLAEQVHGSPFEISVEDEKTDRQKEKAILDKINKEAESNSSYLDFGEENAKLEKNM